LPPATHDIARHGRGLRRPAVARPLRRCTARAVPVPVVRRRDVRAAGMTVELTIETTDGSARAGRAVTASGRAFATPGFMPVGTRGAVRTLDADDLRAAGVQ